MGHRQRECHRDCGVYGIASSFEHVEACLTRVQLRARDRAMRADRDTRISARCGHTPRRSSRLYDNYGSRRLYWRDRRGAAEQAQREGREPSVDTGLLAHDAQTIEKVPSASKP
jgi:hypothetical protein